MLLKEWIVVVFGGGFLLFTIGGISYAFYLLAQTCEDLHERSAQKTINEVRRGEP